MLQQSTYETLSPAGTLLSNKAYFFNCQKQLKPNHNNYLDRELHAFSARHKNPPDTGPHKSTVGARPALSEPFGELSAAACATNCKRVDGETLYLADYHVCLKKHTLTGCTSHSYP